MCPCMCVRVNTLINSPSLAITPTNEQSAGTQTGDRREEPDRDGRQEETS